MFHLVASNEIRLWTLHDGRFARALPGGGSLTALAFSTAGAAKIASATQKLGGTKRVLTFFGGMGRCSCVFVGIGLVNLCKRYILIFGKIDIQCQFLDLDLFVMFFVESTDCRKGTVKIFGIVPRGSLGWFFNRPSDYEPYI